MSDTDTNAGTLAQDASATPAPGSAAVEKPGVQLARQREKLGWSIEQVADQLKLAPRQVIALEADDYDALPALAVVRGFIRAYAKILKIDAAPLVATIAVQASAPQAPTALRSDLSSKFANSSAPLMSKRSHPYAWGAGIVAVLLVGGLVSQHMGWLPAPGAGRAASAPAVAAAPANPAEIVGGGLEAAPSSSTTALPAIDASVPALGATSTSVAAASTSVSPATGPVAGAAAPAVAPQTSTTAARSTAGAPVTTVTHAAPVTTTTRAVAPVVAAPAPAPSTTLAATSTTASAAGALVINVHEDSWVEIKRVGGGVLLSRLLKAGAVETVNIDAPVQMVVGNVAGVDVTLRGAPLSLKSPTGGNTIRMTVK